MSDPADGSPRKRRAPPAKPSSAKPRAAKTSAARTSTAKTSAPKAGGAKPAASKSAASKTGGAKAGAAKPAQPKAGPAQHQTDAASEATDAIGNPWQEFAAMGLDAMESMARNVASAAARAQTMAVSQAADPASGPQLDPDPFHIAPDAARVFGRIASDPGKVADAQMRLWQSYMDLWGSMARRAAGADGSDAFQPEKGDRRWASKDWSDNPMFEVIKETYLLTSRWLDEFIDQADDVDPESKRKVRFFTRQLADAFSPTNFALTNPDVLRATLQSGGDNLVRGMSNLAEDLQRGRGRLAVRQTDMDKFTVGENLASTEGSVIYQNDILQLIHYHPTTPQTYARPILFFPPWINKFYILDMRPENSMVRWLLDQGHAVFLVSWVNPDTSLAGVTFEEYIDRGIYEALAATLKQTRADQVNTIGYCIGGTLLTCALAHMAKTGADHIASATFFAAQTDFAEAGDLLMFVTPDWRAEIERRMDANGGVLDGQTMADTFNMLRANDLIWSFYVNNYLLGKDPRAFDLLYWNSDQTRLSKTLHLFYLKHFYAENELSEGKLELLGHRLSLPDIKVPAYFQASREAHIAPYPSVYRGARLFGGPTRFTLAGSGHIAGVINHPSANKYQHWTNDVSPLPHEVSDWMAGAEEHPGSWWNDWNDFLVSHAGPKKGALHPNKGKFDIIEPAPGSYVRVRS
ncbi:MAG: class I poly(R)-hydroxyalkanoic acid synthase [Caulobacterales bacterium]|nr:class I poly(R)-hydroxyalkanoic acid synthase [Caulobacterales bacterium]